MSASVRPQRRRLAAVCAGTALLALSATACGFEDSAAVGVVTYQPVAAAPAAGHGEEAGEGSHGEETAKDEQAGHGEEAAQEGHGEEQPAEGHGEEAAQEGHGEEAAAGGHGEEAEGVSETNPSIKGCHVMKGGAGKVENHTMTDMTVYVGADCTGESKYVGSKRTGDIAPEADAWNSYRFVQ
ncbi:hypothetical protein RCO28_14825 [Streptomyces sp. LHD-70]|uniref:hypothetical protein n=1 Tax=Streptomyces sp. LHD-70 TaxID=3072140 RepID=UPI00280E2887|nr:hypothetical protein [Streptomyces sp. LHD-70]MDQ8703755.1 hypothetical protein [Streptomyces sp. LHD-70]